MRHHHEPVSVKRHERVAAAALFLAGAALIGIGYFVNRRSGYGGQVVFSLGFLLVASAGFERAVERWQRIQRKPLFVHALRTTVLRLEDVHRRFAPIAQTGAESGPREDVRRAYEASRADIDVIRNALSQRLATHGEEYELVADIWRIEDLFRHCDGRPDRWNATRLCESIRVLRQSIVDRYTKELLELSSSWEHETNGSIAFVYWRASDRVEVGLSHFDCHLRLAEHGGPDPLEADYYSEVRSGRIQHGEVVVYGEDDLTLEKRSKIWEAAEAYRLAA